MKDSVTVLQYVIYDTTTRLIWYLLAVPIKKLNVHTGRATHRITHYILGFKHTDFVSASVILQSAEVTKEDSELPIYVFIV